MIASTHATHGGAFFEAIGVDMQTLSERENVVNADVLDAWYPPSPAIIAELNEHLEWLVRTSPPTHGEGLRRCLAEARGLLESAVLLGAGTSSLMFQVMPMLCGSGESAVVLEPSYGEYPHLLEQVIGANVTRVRLDPEQGFRPDLDALFQAVGSAKLVVLVNPNSPTGVTMTAGEIGRVLNGMAANSTLWVDETYIDFTDEPDSVECLVLEDRRLVVAKSLSKFYALSGVRVGYLAGHPERVAEWERTSPPWGVGLIAQVAAIMALRDTVYYSDMARQTSAQRMVLKAGLEKLEGVKRVFDGEANFLLFELTGEHAGAAVAACAAQGVFLRDCDSLLAPEFHGRFIRTAVKTEAENTRILAVLGPILGQLPA